MGKRKRGGSEATVGAVRVDAPVAGAPDGAAAPTVVPLDIDLELVLRTVRWLSTPPLLKGAAACAQEATRCALLEASRPLVRARAAKYEEDARANKVTKVANGGGQPALLGKRRLLVCGADSAAAAEGGRAPAEGEVGTVALAMMTLAAQPEVLASSACKALRAALHPLVEAHLQEEKASPAFRITCQLALRGRWGEALKLLAEMRRTDSSRRPKLGAYQRWVRELNVAFGDARELLMLDAIMRLAVGMPPALSPAPAEGRLDRHELWRPALAATAAGERAAIGLPLAGQAAGKLVGQESNSEQQASTAGALTSLIAARRAETAQARAEAAVLPMSDSWSVVAHEAALERAPPNRFDLDIFAIRDQAFAIKDPPSPAVARHAVPGVGGAMVLTDVLSEAECARLLATSEAIGYRPDVPLSSTMDERAQNVVILASEEQNSALFDRVRYSLPTEIGGDRLVGLNRRWRLYRYQKGNAYRKHLDGAWPASGTRKLPSGAEVYVYDAHGGGARSRLTFIIYLNEDFEGGATTFFIPKAGQEGTLESRPVRPRVGSATVFPHGECPQPLLHEGSPVEKGTKYLLRTDVVYGSLENSGALKEAARLRGLVRQLGGEAKFSGARPKEAGVDAAQGDETVPKKRFGKGRKLIKDGLKKKATGAQEKDSSGAKLATPEGHKSVGKNRAGEQAPGGPEKKGSKGKKTPRRAKHGNKKR